jgi:hypothetical protein
VCKAAGLDRGTVSLSDDVPLVISPDPEPKQLLSLRQAPPAQFFDGQGREGHRSSVTTLDLLLADLAFVGCSVLAMTASWP